VIATPRLAARYVGRPDDPRTTPRRASLVTCGERIGAIWIRSGIAHVITRDDRPVRMLSVHERGSWVLPEVALLGLPSPYEVIAHTGVEWHHWPVDRLSDEARSGLARAAFAESLRRAELMAGSPHVPVADRVLVALKYLASQPSAMTHPDGMQIRVSRRLIAQMVGCSREMVGRVLTNGELSDVVQIPKRSGRAMVVLDPERRLVRDQVAA